MPTYLLTWNPKQWHWRDDLADTFKKVRGEYFGNWSCGKSQRIKDKDRVFLIRLGKEPKGIVASGYAVSSVYKDKHWDEDLANSGKTALYVKIRLDNLLNHSVEDILSRRSLDKGVLANMHWDSQGSGIQIPDNIAAALEREWARFLSKKRRPVVIAEPLALEGLRTETVRYIRGRSRMLRDLALNQSKGVCSVCEVDYTKVLKGKGVRVLQVHHRKQLAADDGPRPTKLSDLAVVCANCHMLIHMDPTRSIAVDKLRRMLKE